MTESQHSGVNSQRFNTRDTSWEPTGLHLPTHTRGPSWHRCCEAAVPPESCNKPQGFAVWAPVSQPVRRCVSSSWPQELSNLQLTCVTSANKYLELMTLNCSQSTVFLHPQQSTLLALLACTWSYAARGAVPLPAVRFHRSHGAKISPFSRAKQWTKPAHLVPGINLQLHPHSLSCCTCSCLRWAPPCRLENRRLAVKSDPTCSFSENSSGFWSIFQKLTSPPASCMWGEL